jgi:hypothetical protein
MHVVEQIIIGSYNIKRYNNYSKSVLIFKQFDMKEEVNLRIEYDLASCYRFSYYYRFSDIAINSVNPSFI